jgi:hypothetical protein
MLVVLFDQGNDQFVDELRFGQNVQAFEEQVGHNDLFDQLDKNSISFNISFVNESCYLCIK